MTQPFVEPPPFPPCITWSPWSKVYTHSLSFFVPFSRTSLWTECFAAIALCRLIRRKHPVGALCTPPPPQPIAPPCPTIYLFGTFTVTLTGTQGGAFMLPPPLKGCLVTSTTCRQCLPSADCVHFNRQHTASQSTVRRALSPFPNIVSSCTAGLRAAGLCFPRWLWLLSPMLVVFRVYNMQAVFTMSRLCPLSGKSVEGRCFIQFKSRICLV